MATLGTRLYTWFKGELVGRDGYGNRYYREKGVADGRWRRRWVVYKGRPEASKVPPDWHGWLHRTVAEPPSVAPMPEQPWEKEHLPNLTGTRARYLPPGHILRGGKRAPATGDYEAWRPE
jgi:NADH:ubiquinone oxidoreductase subunit